MTAPGAAPTLTALSLGAGVQSTEPGQERGSVRECGVLAPGWHLRVVRCELPVEHDGPHSTVGYVWWTGDRDVTRR